MDSAVTDNKVLKLDKSSWKLAKLDDLANDISKRVDNPGESEYDRFVGLANFVSGDIKIKTWETTENLASSAKAFQAGDILFARRNAYLKRASLVDFDGCCSGDAFVLRENHDKVVPGFLAFLMNSNALWDFANSNAAGTMSKRVKWRDLAEYEFLLPPKDQQAQLAKLLWAMDEVIEKNEETLTRLNELIFVKKNLFFIQGNNALKTQAFSTYEVPKSWAIDKISDVASVEYGISKSVANNTDPNLGWRIITGANINLDGSFDLTKKRYIEVPTKDRFFLEYGDLMFNWRSGSPEHIGKTSFFDLEGEYTYASFILRIRCGERFRNRYAFFLLNFLRDIEYFTKNISKQINFKINAAIFREVKIPIPSLSEQDEMLLILEKFYKQKSELSNQIMRSKSLQKSLINQVFRYGI